MYIFLRNTFPTQSCLPPIFCFSWLHPLAIFRLCHHIRGASIRLQTFSYRHLKLKIQYVIAIHLMRWLINCYDFRFKSTATAGIGIHPTESWLSQVMYFKNAMWTWGHFRRTICNEIMFSTWKKGRRNVSNTSDCFLTTLHDTCISFWVA